MRIEPLADEVAAVKLQHAEHGSKTNPMDTRWLLWKAAQFQGSVLEIGCHRGHTTYELAMANPRRHVWAVDWAENTRLKDWQLCDLLPPSELCERARYLPNVNLLVLDSQYLDYSQLSGLSFVYIDGDHSLEGVKVDTELALAYFARSPKSGHPACIVWHDYAEDGPFGVGPYLRTRTDLDLIRVKNSTLVYMEIE